LALILLVAWSAAAGADGDAIVGVWQTQPEDHGYAHIEIEPQGDEYVGKIVWLSEPDYPEDDADGMGGQPKIDRENPDPALRERPIVGLRLLQGLEYAGDGRWKNGRIYDPANGKSYKCQMKLEDDGSLKVRGFIGFSLLGRSTVWTPVGRESD
jgi:uncharacterized protein (DUF2147 family)